ncbi:DUF6783 domain-containing protein [Ruminococcus sp. 1001136sp1]|uniref:DUF6783 domain-containing protein n=1 Tax=Ruminococcus sp. 1001713B170214_170313_A12 TaxID=2787089 RepID=UPI002FE5AA3E
MLESQDQHLWDSKLFGIINALNSEFHKYSSSFSLRACLKKAFCKMCVTICGRFCPDEGAVAGYGN